MMSYFIISTVILSLLFLIYKLKNEKKLIAIIILLTTTTIMLIHIYSLFKNGNYVVGSDSTEYINKAKQVASNFKNGVPMHIGIYYLRNSYKLFTSILSLGYIISENDYLAMLYNYIFYLIILNIFMCRIINLIDIKKNKIIILFGIAISTLYSPMICSRDIYIVIIIFELFIITKKIIDKKSIFKILYFISLLILLDCFREDFSTIYISCLIIILFLWKCSEYFNSNRVKNIGLGIFVGMYIFIFPIVFDEFVFENVYGMQSSFFTTIKTFAITIFSDNPFKFLAYKILKVDVNSWIDTNMSEMSQIIFAILVVFYIYYIFISNIEYIVSNKILSIGVLYGIIVYLTYSMSFNVQYRIKMAVILPLASLFLVEVNILKPKIKYKKNKINIIFLGLLFICILDFSLKVITKL